MEKNVGGYDRIARFVLGPALIVVGAAALLGLFTIAAGTLGLAIAVIAVLVGLVLSVTAVTQKCPLNNVLGMNTYRGEETTDSTTEGDVGRTA
jgi:hypothetical protein